MATAPIVCIVDDAADYRSILKRLFSSYFPAYSVRFSSDGHDFLTKLAHLSPLPNLILLNLHMPIFDGYQTLLFLKEHPLFRKIPVVMMSAGASVDQISACYEAGANSFLSKPIDFAALKEQFDLTCRYWLDANRMPVYSLPQPQGG